MAIDVGKVHARSMESFQAAFAEESAAYQRAMLSGDVDEAARAASTMAGLRATVSQLNSMAQEAYAASAPRADANKYGLSPDEVTIARGLASNDRNMSNDERERTYAEQKYKLQRMRADGTYRDDQGSVRR